MKGALLKLIKLSLQISGVVVSLLVVASYKVMVQGGYGLPLRRLVTIGAVWIAIWLGVYKLSEWIAHKKKPNSTIILILGWFNLISWTIGLVGLIVSSSTMAFSELLQYKQKRFFQTLSYISILLSIFNLIGVIFKLDNLLRIIGSGIIIAYPLLAIISYFIYVHNVKVTKVKAENQRSMTNLYIYGLGIVFLVFLLGLLFYWFEIRPVNIRSNCSWFTHKVEVSYCEYLKKMKGDSSNLSFEEKRELLKCPDENQIDYKTRKATQKEYKFCIQSKGLVR